MEWPIYFKNILRVGNLKSNVGVVTLWTERDVVANALKKSDYAVVGNLYAAAGINHMLRNIFANPRIRYLLMWGADMSQSGHALLKFMQKGIGPDYAIKETRGEIEKEIPLKAIKDFRKNVRIIDLRGKPLNMIADSIRSLPQLPPFAHVPQIFPQAKPQVTELPAESAGFRAEADTVAQTWLKIINLISLYGKTERSRYSSNNQLKEVLNLTAVVNREHPEEEYFPHYLPFSRDELKSYYPEMTTSRRIPGVAYNYGHRMRKYFGIDQIEKIKKLLKQRPFSKKAVAVLYDPKKDWADADGGDTPCLTQIMARVAAGKLYLTGAFRSQDMFHGWPRNAFALHQIQKEIADYLRLPMAPLITITHSAHIYADDWQTAAAILQDNYLSELKYEPRFPHLKLDPRGNWLIDVDYKAGFTPGQFYCAPAHTYAIKQRVRSLKGKIIARHFPDATMSRPDWVIEGRTAKEVYWQIVDWERLVLPSHCFLIGEELTKAEIALRMNISFKMDAPLVL